MSDGRVGCRSGCPRGPIAINGSRQVRSAAYDEAGASRSFGGSASVTRYRNSTTLDGKEFGLTSRRWAAGPVRNSVSEQHRHDQHVVFSHQPRRTDSVQQRGAPHKPHSTVRPPSHRPVGGGDRAIHARGNAVNHLDHERRHECTCEQRFSADRSQGPQNLVVGPRYRLVRYGYSFSVTP